MRFELPRRRIFPVDTVDVRLLEGPHPFEEGREAEIAANWKRELALKPALFDGGIMLLSELRYGSGALSGACHLTRYSTFLLWRSLRPVETAGHAFAHAALVGSDNALVAIRMGAATITAGQVYFAAGSFEPQDFHGGCADLPFNMRREVGEETGLDLDDAQPEAGMVAYSDDAGTAIFRRYRFAETADALAGRISAFAAAEADPEIAGPVVIRAADDRPDGLMPHMAAFARWHFGG